MAFQKSKLKAHALLKASTLYLVGNLASKAASVLMVPLYTHFLSTSDYGFLELVDLSINVVLTSLGFSILSSSMVRVFHDGEGEKGRNAVVSSAIWGTVIAGIIVLAIGLLVAGQASQLLFHSGAQTRFLQANILSMLLVVLVDLCLTYQQLKDRPLFYVRYNLVQLVLTVVLNIYFIVVRHAGVWSFIYSKLLVTVPGLVLLLFVTLREVGFKFRLDPLRRMISFGAPLILSFTSFFVIHFSDRFFVNAYVSLSALGVYSLAYKYGFLVSYLIGEPFGRAWNVRFYEFLKQPEWRSDFARVARYLFFALVLGGAVLSLFAGPVFKVIAGPAFRQGALFAPVIVGAYVLRECGDFFRNLLYINKRSTVVGYTGLLCAVVNISLNFLLIPRFGMWGAAWATMATWLVYALALGVIAQLEHRLPLSFRRIGALFALAVAAVWAASRCTGYSPVLDLAAPVCLLGALCGGTLLSGYFSREELVFVRNAVCYAMKRLFSARITT